MPMLRSELLPIDTLWDLDGTTLKGPPPVVTVFLERFKHRKSTEEKKYDTELNAIARWFSIFRHQGRVVRTDALLALRTLQELQLSEEREITASVLTGRQEHLHEMTKERLRLLNLEQFFAAYYLNLGGSSAGWKAGVVSDKVAQQRKAVHLDDDPRAAVAVAEVDQDQVLVYLLQNWATKTTFLQWSGIVLPPNVVLVQSLQEAIKNLRERITSGAF